MRRLRVLIVDDTMLMRQGIKSLLEKSGTIEFVGEAPNAQEAIELGERLAPDVILLDQDIPAVDSVEAVRSIKRRLPKAEIIALAETADNERAFRLLEAGATGYLLKDIDPASLLRAIEGVGKGETLMNPQVTRQLVERFRALVREVNGKGGMHQNGLSNREMEILLELTKGATDREIARKIYASTTTVKSHIRSIYRKIGARNRTQAVAHVLRNGLVS